MIYSKYERSMIFSWQWYFVHYVIYAHTKDLWYFLDYITNVAGNLCLLLMVGLRLLFAACLICILAACTIGRPDLSCIAHNSSIWEHKPFPSGVFLYRIRAKGRFHPSTWLLITSILQGVQHFLLVHWIDGNMVNLLYGVHQYVPLPAWFL